MLLRADDGFLAGLIVSVIARALPPQVETGSCNTFAFATLRFPFEWNGDDIQ
jgi:hypothetical protein